MPRACAWGACSTTTSRATAARSICAGSRSDYRLVLPREIEQLLHEPCGAPHARLEPRERLLALRALGHALEELELQRDRRKRRAQLVRRVADERALAVEGAPEPGEEIIERGDERPHLVGHGRLGKRLERARSARRDRARESGERRKAPPHHEPDQSREQGQCDEQRHEHAQRRFRGTVAPQAHRLRDLHDLVLGVDAEHAPVAAVRRHRAQADGRAHRHEARARHEHHRAVRAPHLDHEVLGAAPAGPAALEDTVAQGDSHLLQLIVEELGSLVVGGAIDADGDERARDRDRGEQPDEQRAPDRAHDRFASM